MLSFLCLHQVLIDFSTFILAIHTVIEVFFILHTGLTETRNAVIKVGVYYILDVTLRQVL